ncbi:MAG: FAD-dependent oxidoreductase, partial [Eubacteriaceae bacterium]|nr:FAD-dependent oxidoreductase [Eubacteriaceae bacterium]
MDNIIIKGAKENNLRNIDLTIPRDRFIVFTGLSGSGKSSLAFDTIYAEGQRRYVESLSAYARQFLGQVNKPDVESIEGLSPAISIDQKTTNRNPRSTVGTVTEIYDYFRLLYARIGVPHCPQCGREVKAQSIDVIVDEIMSGEENERFMILSPVVRGEKGTQKKLIESLASDGYVRAVIDGELCELSEAPELDKNRRHDISVVVDRLTRREGIRSRLFDSVQTALKLSEGLAVYRSEAGEKLYSENFSCPECGISFHELEPRDFSFNSPFGMCPECSGIGYHTKPDPDKLIPDMSLSLNGGAVKFYNTNEDGYYFTIITELAKHYGVDPDRPLSEAPQKFIHALLYGDDTVLTIHFNSYFSGYKTTRVVFEGVVNNLMRRYRETSSDFMKEKMDEFMSSVECASCHGKRLNPISLAVTVGGKNIMEVTEMSVAGCRDYLRGLELSDKDANAHFEDNIGGTGDWRRPGPVYEIPYRTLYTAGLKNVLSAGRCISTAREAWEIVRCIPQAALTGQAAGTALTMAIASGETVQALDVAALRARLAAAGVLLDINKKDRQERPPAQK